jgi:nicotinamidase/pyrazinamidase
MATLELDLLTDALIVVDLQPDFMPGGALAVPRGDEIAEPIGALARRFELVVATQDWHPAGHVSFASSHEGRAPFETVSLYGSEQVLWPEHCVSGSPGAALHPALDERDLTLILRKGTRREVDSYSGFLENVGPGGGRPSTGLAGWLRERGARRLFVCGLARDFCVKSTAIDGARLGFEVHLLDDLTRAVDAGSAARIDAELREAGCRTAVAAQLGGGR